MIKSVGSRLEKENKEPYNRDAIVTFQSGRSYMNFDLPPTNF